MPSSRARAWRGQLVFGRGPRGGHGRDDAAARGGDAGVGLSREPSPELRPPVAGEDGVRVGVDEAGEDGPLARVDDARVAGNRDRALEIGGGPGKDDRGSPAVARAPSAMISSRPWSAPRRGAGPAQVTS